MQRSRLPVKHQLLPRQNIKISTKGKLESKFIGSYPCNSDLIKSNYPFIVFAGRSNCGKSTLLNHLTGDIKLARVSSTPGRTRTINFFLIDNKIIFADLPGYGYSKASMSVKQSISKNVDGFLTSNAGSIIIVSLLDIRVMPSEDDIELKEWADANYVPVIYVLTKSDKLPRSKRSTMQTKICKELRLVNSSGNKPILYSSVTGEGRSELIRSLEDEIKSFSA